MQILNQKQKEKGKLLKKQFDKILIYINNSIYKLGAEKCHKKHLL
jgi:hypothetical protein